MNAEFLENNIHVTESEGSYAAEIKRKNIDLEGFLGAYVVSKTRGAYTVSSAVPNGDKIDITAGPFTISYNPATAESTVSYSEGGSGGGGDSEPLIIRLTGGIDPETYQPLPGINYDPSEIIAAWNAGKRVLYEAYTNPSGPGINELYPVIRLTYSANSYESSHHIVLYYIDGSFNPREGAWKYNVTYCKITGDDKETATVDISTVTTG